MKRILLPGLLLQAALALGACRETIEQDLDRREASEILARLSAHGIGADRVAGRDASTQAVQVDSSDRDRAVRVLAQEGLPRRRHDGFKAAYREKGLVAGKWEEQGRFLSALQEELAETLEAVEGVLAARVHLAPPADGGRAGAEAASPASAAVLIAFRKDATDATPIAASDVQRLVAHAYPGLTPERVAVVFSRVSALPAPPPPPAGAAWLRLGAGGLGLGGCAAGLALVWVRRARRRPS